MDLPDPNKSPSIEDMIERLAQTVAHLALQLTVAQIQLRALGGEISDRGLVTDQAVLDRAAALANDHAGTWLAENLGPTLTGLVDLPQLERQVVDFLASETSD